MGWKNWPYWLRGAIIGLIINLITSFIPAILPNSIFNTFFSNLWNTSNKEGSFFVLFIILPALSFFIMPLLGALIGWIIGKIKPQEEIQKSTNGDNNLESKIKSLGWFWFILSIICIILLVFALNKSLNFTCGPGDMFGACGIAQAIVTIFCFIGIFFFISIGLISLGFLLGKFRFRKTFITLLIIASILLLLGLVIIHSIYSIIPLFLIVINVLTLIKLFENEVKELFNKYNSA